MKRVWNFWIFVAFWMAFLFSGCASAPPENPVYRFTPPEHKLDYLRDVEPILVKRCVVCHSCYNSPCQLKLSSWDGFQRGGSKDKIYNASRLRSMDPSRLLVDAHSEEQWRKKGFFSVTESDTDSSYQDSLVYLLMDHKRVRPEVRGDYYPEADDLTCAENSGELDSYFRKHPNGGMPFGFPPLEKAEFDTVVGWLSQGARGPTFEQQEQLKAVPAADRSLLECWEKFLNNPDAKHRITARYLFEHLFLAHISFKTGSGAYYELVRSRSAPGEPVDIIATVRPYEDPGIAGFYYRFRKIYSTIVYKTHMVFPFDAEQFERVNELFIEPDWHIPPHSFGYDRKESANPFRIFEQIPARSRYQWLLDNVRYVITTFIRGPVCRGQVALNVINDHFWLLFLDPEYDLSVKYPGFLRLHYQNLRMPIENGSDHRLYKVLLKNRHYKWAMDYYKARQQFYGAHYPDGLGLEAIWKGNHSDDQPVLTVFRHFDSASVHRGVQGNLPKTVWVIDYPLLERIYYALVAGFDVYGNAGHQLAIRLYMDALRIEGESYFLDFMPAGQRREMMLEEWYTGVMQNELHYFPAPIPAGIAYATDDPKRELMELLVNRYFAASGVGFDQNYRKTGGYPEMPATFTDTEDYLNGFIAASAPGVSFFRHMVDYNANVAWVRIKDIPGEEDKVVSVVVDRWHDNVKFVLGEDLRLDPEKDRADFIEGFVGSYPNYFLVVSAPELTEFFDILDNFDNSDEYNRKLSKFGVNRADPHFWVVYDWFQEAFDSRTEQYPGLIDLNRYYHYASER